MRIYSVFLFLICLNVGVYILTAGQIFGGNVPEQYTDPAGFGSMFAIGGTTLTLLVMGGVGVFTTLLSGMLLQNITMGALAGIIWVVGIFLTPIRWVLTGFPLFVSSLATGMGVPAAIGTIFSSVLTVFYTFIFFMFLMEMFSQRYER